MTRCGVTSEEWRVTVHLVPKLQLGNAWTRHTNSVRSQVGASEREEGAGTAWDLARRRLIRRTGLQFVVTRFIGSASGLGRMNAATTNPSNGT